MRRIGTLSDEALARRFVNYLLTQSVNAVIDASPDDKSWEIWIRNEDDMEVARGCFSAVRSIAGRAKILRRC